MPKQLLERGRLLEATTTADGGVRRPIQIITPGWGSSGYYSAEVLEAAANDKVIPAGTHMYLNHASESERTDRPERDVEKIAAVLVEDARWDGTRLLANADLIGPHAELIEALAPYIGVSISGSATDVTIGEAEGRTGPIIEGLAHVSSVDFVTHAGRGGMVLLESARPSLVNARAIGHGIGEATANDTREQLQTLVRDAYGAEKTYVWVRDFDDTTVWFEVESGEDSGVFGQAYTGADGVIALSGDRTEVRVSTTYVPVTRPDSTIPTTEADQEVTMGNIQIEESEHRSLVEKAGRVDALESERDTQKARGDAAEAKLAERDRTDRARVVIGEAAKKAEVTLDDRMVKGYLSEVKTLESGEIDETALTKLVETELAEAKTRAGHGTISGFGGTPVDPPAISESDIDAAVGGAFGRPVKEA